MSAIETFKFHLTFLNISLIIFFFWITPKSASFSIVLFLIFSPTSIVLFLNFWLSSITCCPTSFSTGPLVRFPGLVSFIKLLFIGLSTTIRFCLWSACPLLLSSVIFLSAGLSFLSWKLSPSLTDSSGTLVSSVFSSLSARCNSWSGLSCTERKNVKTICSLTITSTWILELRGAMVSRLDFYAGDPGSIPNRTEFQTGNQFWVIT